MLESKKATSETRCSCTSSPRRLFDFVTSGRRDRICMGGPRIVFKVLTHLPSHSSHHCQVPNTVNVLISHVPPNVLPRYYCFAHSVLIALRLGCTSLIRHAVCTLWAGMSFMSRAGVSWTSISEGGGRKGGPERALGVLKTCPRIFRRTWLSGLLICGRLCLRPTRPCVLGIWLAL